MNKFLLLLDDRTIYEPTWEEIHQALYDLSNHNNVVTLAKDDDSGLLYVSGGERNFVTVSYFNNHSNEQSILLNAKPQNIEYEMMIGNQRVPVSDKVLIPIIIAEKICHLFFHDKEILEGSEFQWKTQPM